MGQGKKRKNQKDKCEDRQWKTERVECGRCRIGKSKSDIRKKYGTDACLHNSNEMEHVPDKSRLYCKETDPRPTVTITSKQNKKYKQSCTALNPRCFQ